MAVVQILAALGTVELQHPAVTHSEICRKRKVLPERDGEITGVEGRGSEGGGTEGLAGSVRGGHALKIREGRALGLVLDEDPPLARDEILEFGTRMVLA